MYFQFSNIHFAYVYISVIFPSGFEHVYIKHKFHVSAHRLKYHSTFSLRFHCLPQLEVDPAGPAFDLEVPLEIIIGTIPLRQIVQQYYPQAVQPPAPQPSAPPAGAGAMLPPDLRKWCTSWLQLSK